MNSAAAAEPAEFSQPGLFPTHEQQRVLSAALGDGERALAAYAEWRRSLRIEDDFDYQVFRLLPLLYDNLRRLGVQDSLMGRLKGTYRLTWAKSHRLFDDIRPAIEALRSAGIRVMGLKGLPLALAYYGNVALRPMGDIDLAVRRADIHRALQVLGEIGFKPLHPINSDALHYAHALPLRAADGRELDLHWDLVFDCGPGAEAAFWSTSEIFSLVGHDVEMPNPTMMLLHTLIHGMRWNLEPPVRWVPDAMQVMRQRPADIDWHSFVAFARDYRLTHRVGIALRYLRSHFDAPVPESVIVMLQTHPRDWLQRIEERTILRNHDDIYNTVLGPLALALARFGRRAPPGGRVTWLFGFLEYLRYSWGRKRIRDLVPFVLYGIYSRLVRRPLHALFAHRANRPHRPHVG